MNDKFFVDDLAIFGSSPAFQDTLHVGRPNIGSRDRLLERINDMLDRRWLTNDGIYVREFEQKIADHVGVKHCIVMCNATIALEIAIRALDLQGEVIVPSFTFIATAHALQWQEITPVFCDIDPRTHNIDPDKISSLITPRTSGIIGVHVWGRPCAVEELSEIADRLELKLLFDAAHAFGCSHRGTMIGNFGDAEVFSFHATKFLNSFEGGAVVTNDDDLAQKIRWMRNFGFVGYDEVIYLGTNGKMPEVCAAMGVSSLEYLDELIAVNRQNYEDYREEFTGLPGIKLIYYDDSESCNFQYIILEVDEKLTNISRDLLVEILHAENIIARRYFYPGCHQMEPYRSYFPHAGLLLPETEKLTKKVLSLPTGTSIGREEIKTISQVIRLAIENAGQISSRIPKQFDHVAINDLANISMINQSMQNHTLGANRAPTGWSNL